MQTPPKHFKLRQELIFSGLRWPKAKAIGLQTDLAVSRGDGTTSTHSGFVNLAVASGKGRPFTPEPVDASWRNLAEMNLGSLAEAEDFVRRRGEPYGLLAPDRPVTTVTWHALHEALGIAARLWLPPDATATSHPNPDPAAQRATRAFFDHPATRALLQTFIIVPSPDLTGLSVSLPTLAAFLTMRAAQAVGGLAPLRRCAQCGFWFEVRRLKQQSRFCSASCRALSHLDQESEHGLDA